MRMQGNNKIPVLYALTLVTRQSQDAWQLLQQNDQLQHQLEECHYGIFALESVSSLSSAIKLLIAVSDSLRISMAMQPNYEKVKKRKKRTTGIYI
jgi:hypothetical protein